MRSRWLRHCANVAIISGSFLSGVTYHAHQLGISYVSAGTNIEYDADDRFIKLTSEGDESNAKVRHLVKLCEEIGIKLTECACVGDGANDIGLFRATGQGICFSDAREDVITEAATTIESLSDLLDIFTSPHKREGE